MKITIRFFASLRDTVGSDQVTLEVSHDARLQEVVDRLIDCFPGVEGQQASWHFAVNQVHADLDTRLEAGDRVAIFPYVAGG